MISLAKAIGLIAAVQKLIAAGRCEPFIQIEKLPGKLFVKFHGLTTAEAEMTADIGERYSMETGAVAGEPGESIAEWQVRFEEDEWPQVTALIAQCGLRAS